MGGRFMGPGPYGPEPFMGPGPYVGDPLWARALMGTLYDIGTHQVPIGTHRVPIGGILWPGAFF